MTRNAVSLLLLALLVAAGCSSTRRLDLSRPSTQLDVGVRAARGNLWREALFRFERAVQLDPSDAMARNNLAVAYEGIGEFEKAREAYQQALQLDRSNQYIQKNYSRFVEFYSKNKKRQKSDEAEAAKPAAVDEGSTPQVIPPGPTPPTTGHTPADPAPPTAPVAPGTGTEPPPPESPGPPETKPPGGAL